MAMTLPEQLRAVMDAWDRYEGSPQDDIPIGDGDRLSTRQVRQFLTDLERDLYAVSAVLTLSRTEDGLTVDMRAALALLEDRYLMRMVEAHLTQLDTLNPLVAGRLRKALDYERLD